MKSKINDPYYDYSWQTTVKTLGRMKPTKGNLNFVKNDVLKVLKTEAEPR